MRRPQVRPPPSQRWTRSNARMTDSIASGKSIRQQCEGPHGAALRHPVLELLARRVPPQAADAGKDGHVLPAVVSERDRLGVDARAGLELPELFAVLDIERDEFAGLLAGEQE